MTELDKQHNSIVTVIPNCDLPPLSFNSEVFFYPLLVNAKDLNIRDPGLFKVGIQYGTVNPGK